MPIHLYQSRKVKRYLGDHIYMDSPWPEEQIDPLTIWYVDVFFINRARYLVLANPLTKLTFFVFKYSRKTHKDFLETFHQNLSVSIRAGGIDPTLYLQKCELFVPYTQTNRSATAHLSRIKQDYEYSIASDLEEMPVEIAENQFNTKIIRNPCSFGGPGFDMPIRRFHHELLLRRWV
ncbi:DUF6933 domain-containing protein [Marinoscillum furvescens]|uniref:DUF6933 domain-containing protein n=1 Tax=Marinoscillum furvescens DSM 4134 TaxID=1122208 RepID=A0A3D9KW90_MARFU|nr:hypothetical protein [Marinoscillum furvescens]RED92233.1 hypothetical protein C7460_13245 [Marinoscillum furvescens DSM 4134]